MSKIIFFPANIYAKRKRDLLIVFRLQRFGTAFRYKTTPSPTLRIIYGTRKRAHTYTRSIGILVSPCLVTLSWNLPDFCKSKQSALKTLFIMSVSHRTNRTFPDVSLQKKCTIHVVQLQNTAQNYIKNLKYTNFMSLFFVIF